MKIIIATVCLCLCLLDFGILAKIQSNEGDLINALLSSYNRLARPHNDKDNIEVKFGLTLVDLLDVTDYGPESRVTMVTWVSMEWVDPGLAWNPEEYNVTSIRLPRDVIWTPDIIPYNSLNRNADLDWSVSTVVTSDGAITAILPNQITIHCANQRRSQAVTRCALKFGSWTYDGSALNLTSKSDHVDISVYNNRKWDLTRHTATRHVVVYECCLEPYIDITYDIDFKYVAHKSANYLMRQPVHY